MVGRIRLALVASVALVALLLVATPASAATCADYGSQAEAQRAADTRDPDGDGIYCESNPCPCLKPGEGGGGGGGGSTPAKPRKKKVAQVIDARITDVVDGDTIKVRAYGAERRHYTVRLIGIDTPETKRPGVGIECGGPEASAYMLKLAYTSPSDDDGDGLLDTEGGDRRRVTLRTDPTQDTFDRYGRLLAYVTTRAGIHLQTRMLSAGWATTYVFGGKPFQHVKGFRKAERRARHADRGVYGECGGDFHREEAS
jgi:micrococcal nuclease